MKVIFLDIDGVLNTQPHLQPALKNRSMLDPTIVARLGRMARSADSMIVVNSSWRKQFTLDELATLLGGVLKPYLFDKTETRDEPTRAQRILNWLGDRTDVENFVILDDSDLGEGKFEKWNGKVVGEHWVQINPEYGFTPYDAMLALRILTYGSLTKAAKLIRPEKFGLDRVDILEQP